MDAGSIQQPRIYPNDNVVRMGIEGMRAKVKAKVSGRSSAVTKGYVCVERERGGGGGAECA